MFMNKLLSGLAALSALTFVAGCATDRHGDRRFGHPLPSRPADRPRPIAIEAADPRDAGSLEFSQIATSVGARTDPAGLDVVPSRASEQVAMVSAHPAIARGGAPLRPQRRHWRRDRLLWPPWRRRVGGGVAIPVGGHGTDLFGRLPARACASSAAPTRPSPGKAAPRSRRARGRRCRPRRRRGPPRRRAVSGLPRGIGPHYQGPLRPLFSLG